jgi:TRAP-type C4-dicarboxylate transport system permease small subunit
MSGTLAETYIRVVGTASRLAGWLSMLLLAAAVLVVCQMIVVRYVLAASTVWQTEFVIYSLVAATLLGSPYVLMLKGHVGIDLVTVAVGKRARLLLQITGALIAMGFLGILGWSGWLYLHEAWARGWTTETVWAPPLWIPLLPLPVGIGLLILQYIAELLALARDDDR